MTPEQIANQIIELCSYHVDVDVNDNRGSGTTITMEGDFTPKDLLGIVELLKNEGLL